MVHLDWSALKEKLVTTKEISQIHFLDNPQKATFLMKLWE